MEFAFVSGRPCLDFVGTLKWRGTDREEQLPDASALAEWATVSGLLDRALPVTPTDFEAAITVREAIYCLTYAASAGAPLSPLDIEVVNTAAEGLPVAMALTSIGALSRQGNATALLSTLARDTLDLLGSDAAHRLRQCARPSCTRLFVDTSRAQNRRWCGMAECGNYTKVTEFRRRGRKAGTERP